MLAKSLTELKSIAEFRGITYEAPEEEIKENQRIVKTTLSRDFPIDRELAFASFADPQTHVKYFDIIQSCTPLIPLEGALEPNAYIVLEKVQEENLPPRLMIIKYTLNPPFSILKEAITNPFDDSLQLMDRKKGIVAMRFEEMGRNSTKITCESTFTTTNGPVFVRGFIDHVWFNFYEKLMVDFGEISRDEMITG